MAAEGDFYDLAIIGGGTNGPAIFLTALLGGFKKVAVIERGLIGRGKNNRAANYASLGMIQPGLKYIASDLEIVKTDALDCRLLRVFAGEFLRRCAFILPVYEHYLWHLRQPLVWSAIFRAYDEFSKIALHPPHQKLSLKELKILEPGLRSDSLVGAFRFYEWLANPLKLASAFVSAGARLGGTVFENCEVREFEIGEAGGAKCIKAAIAKDAGGGQVKIRAKYFVSACGAWTAKTAELMEAKLNLRPTSGTSLILRGQLSKNPLIVFDEHGRYCAILPGENETLVGPTNLDVSREIYDNPELLEPAFSEKLELVRLAGKLLEAKPSPDDILETRCGIRPQLDHRCANPYDVTHAFAVFDHKNVGLANAFSVAGGKLTCQMRIAKEVMEKVCAAAGKKFSWPIPGLKVNAAGEISEQSSPLLDARDYQEQLGLNLELDENIGKKISKRAFGNGIKAKLNLAKNLALVLLRDQ